MKIQRQKQLYEEIIIKFENSNSLFKSMVLANEHDRDLLTVIFIYYNKVFQIILKGLKDNKVFINKKDRFRVSIKKQYSDLIRIIFKQTKQRNIENNNSNTSTNIVSKNKKEKKQRLEATLMEKELNKRDILINQLTEKLKILESKSYSTDKKKEVDSNNNDLFIVKNLIAKEIDEKTLTSRLFELENNEILNGNKEDTCIIVNTNLNESIINSPVSHVFFEDENNKLLNGNKDETCIIVDTKSNESNINSSVSHFENLYNENKNNNNNYNNNHFQPGIADSYNNNYSYDSNKNNNFFNHEKSLSEALEENSNLKEENKRLLEQVNMLLEETNTLFYQIRKIKTRDFN